jgi:hypothetical protein
MSVVFCVMKVITLERNVLTLICLRYVEQGEPSFHLFGFIMCISATAARALKSVLQGILLSSEG